MTIKLVFYGNCQIKQIFLALSSYLDQEDRYACEYFSSYLISGSNDQDGLKIGLSRADVVFTNISRHSRNAVINMDELLNLIRPSTSLCIVPFLRFDGYWPLHRNRYNEQFWYPAKCIETVRVDSFTLDLQNEPHEIHWNESVKKLDSIIEDSDPIFRALLGNALDKITTNVLFHDEWHPHSSIIYLMLSSITTYLTLSLNPPSFISYDESSMRIRLPEFIPKQPYDCFVRGNMPGALCLPRNLMTFRAFYKFSVAYMNLYESQISIRAPHSFLHPLFVNYANNHLRRKSLILEEIKVETIRYSICQVIFVRSKQKALYNLMPSTSQAYNCSVWHLGFASCLDDLLIDDVPIHYIYERLLIRIPLVNSWYRFEMTDFAALDSTSFVKQLGSISCDAFALLPDCDRPDELYELSSRSAVSHKSKMKITYWDTVGNNLS